MGFDVPVCFTVLFRFVLTPPLVAISMKIVRAESTNYT